MVSEGKHLRSKIICVRRMYVLLKSISCIENQVQERKGKITQFCLVRDKKNTVGHTEF